MAQSSEIDALVRAFYREHNPRKLDDADVIVAEAVDLGLTARDVEKALADKYGLHKTKQATAAAATSGRTAVAAATPPAAARAETNHDVPFGQSALHKGRGGAAARARTDDVLVEQIRGWVLDLLRTESPETAALQDVPYAIDALRDGVLLRWVSERIMNPSLAKFSRARRGGMISHDNVAVFLHVVHTHCRLPTSETFTTVDLVDGKNDRAVVTCLLALGRWALDNGHVAPKVAAMDREIEEQQRDVTDAAIERAIADAENDAVLSSDIVSEDDASDGDDVLAEATDDVEVALQLAPIVQDEPEPSEPLPRPAHSSSPPAPQQYVPVTVHASVRPAAAAPQTVSASPTRREDSVKRYQPRRGDQVDQRVGRAYNKLVARAQKTGKRLNARIARTGRNGEYIIYHRITGKRTVVYVRELSNALMIRVGGGWEDFESYLARRLVDYEVARPGTAEARSLAERRRANTVSRR